MFHHYSLLFRSMQSAALALTLALSGLSAAQAAGNPTAGMKVYEEECSDCHSITEGRQKKGPSLFGVVGRHAGQVADFGKYSEALKASTITWSEDRINSYITDPKKFMAGGKMKYDGLEDAKQRDDLIAFLATLR